MTITPSFWAGRRVLVTGHTGFKGGWLSLCLAELGADVTGISLAVEDRDAFFWQAGVGELVDSHLVDLLDRPRLDAAVLAADPQVVLHLAAQALVLPGLEQPVETFTTNVIGTATLMAASAQTEAEVVLAVTSDKVYANDGAGRPFVEGDPLGGGDPYSASKAAAEMVVASWRHTFTTDGRPALATARAGNVIGGGDVAVGRLLPDLLRSFAAGEPTVLRNPASRRPWQFVLDPVAGYLMYAERLATVPGGTLPTALNFGPMEDDALTVAEIADLAIDAWGEGSWRPAGAAPSVEAPVLRLDASLAHEVLGWEPVLRVDEAVRWTVEWLRCEVGGGDTAACSREQLARYRERAGW
jgi:CDP-glucose 4,6-dehydratase